MYNKVTENDIEFLRAATSPDRVLVGDEISEDYSHDELAGVKAMPEVLVRVLYTEEVSKIMKHAYERNIPVVVRGSGTGLVGACVAINGGIMIETAFMNKILELDTENLAVTVQPGVLLMELAAFVEEHDLFYPPDPGEKSATIGGNISTNAGGMRAVKYGVTRDYVRGLTVVLPNGEIETFGGKVVKNSGLVRLIYDETVIICAKFMQVDSSEAIPETNAVQLNPHAAFSCFGDTGYQSENLLFLAQNNPDDYKDLIVRVAGYSDFFRNLSKPLQDEIINRTEQSFN